MGGENGNLAEFPPVRAAHTFSGHPGNMSREKAVCPYRPITFPPDPRTLAARPSDVVGRLAATVKFRCDGTKAAVEIRRGVTDPSKNLFLRIGVSWPERVSRCIRVDSSDRMPLAISDFDFPPSLPASPSFASVERGGFRCFGLAVAGRRSASTGASKIENVRCRSRPWSVSPSPSPPPPLFMASRMTCTNCALVSPLCASGYRRVYCPRTTKGLTRNVWATNIAFFRSIAEFLVMDMYARRRCSSRRCQFALLSTGAQDQARRVRARWRSLAVGALGARTWPAGSSDPPSTPSRPTTTRTIWSSFFCVPQLPGVPQTARGGLEKSDLACLLEEDSGVEVELKTCLPLEYRGCPPSSSPNSSGQHASTASPLPHVSAGSKVCKCVRGHVDVDPIRRHHPAGLGRFDRRRGLVVAC